MLGFSCYSGSGVDSGMTIESIVCGPGVTNCKNVSRRKRFGDTGGPRYMRRKGTAYNEFTYKKTKNNY